MKKSNLIIIFVLICILFSVLAFASLYYVNCASDLTSYYTDDPDCAGIYSTSYCWTSSNLHTGWCGANDGCDLVKTPGYTEWCGDVSSTICNTVDTNSLWVRSGETFTFGGPTVPYTAALQWSCCGNGQGENYYSQICDGSAPCSSDSSDQACCNPIHYSQCVYEGYCYGSLFDGGVSCTGNVGGNCVNTGSNGWMVCDSGTWYDPDSLSAACTNIGATWFNGYCCGDDPSESFTQCSADGSISWAGSCNGNSGLDSCCTNSGSCSDIYGNCVNSGNAAGAPTTNDQISVCDSGTWHDADENSGYCAAAGGFWNVNAGQGYGNYGDATGELSFTNCCGDDAHENYMYQQIQTTMFTGWTGSSFNYGDNACCDYSIGDYCVFNHVCYKEGDVRGDYFCGGETNNYWQWYNFDDNGDGGAYISVENANGGECIANGGYWDVGGSGDSTGDYPLTKCCGDDNNEVYQTRVCALGACSSNSGDKTCCNVWTECVWGGVCYADGATYSNYQCNLGTWKKQQGQSCSGNGQCYTGNCVDGVCCNNGCGGFCQACSAAKKHQGSDGTCGNIAFGYNPDSECTDSGWNGCNSVCVKSKSNAGYCDGTGNCAGTYMDVSGGQVCSSGSEVNPSSSHYCDETIQCASGSCSAARYYRGCINELCTDTNRQSTSNWYTSTNQDTSETTYKVGSSCNQDASYCGNSGYNGCTGSGSPYSCQRKEDEYRCDGSGNCNYDSGNDNTQNIPSGDVCTSSGTVTSGSSTYYSSFAGYSSCVGSGSPYTCQRRGNVDACDGSGGVSGPVVGTSTANIASGSVCTGSGSVTSGSSTYYSSFVGYSSCVGSGSPYTCQRQGNVDACDGSGGVSGPVVGTSTANIVSGSVCTGSGSVTSGSSTYYSSFAGYSSCVGSGSPYTCQRQGNVDACDGSGGVSGPVVGTSTANIASGSVCTGSGSVTSGSSTYYSSLSTYNQCTGSGSPYTCQRKRDTLACDGSGGIAGPDVGDSFSFIASGSVCSGSGTVTLGSSTYYSSLSGFNTCPSICQKKQDTLSCDGSGGVAGPDVGDNIVNVAINDYCSGGGNELSGTCNAAWQCASNQNTNANYGVGYSYYTQGYCDATGVCDRSGADVTSDGDSSAAACECLVSGTQGNCGNGGSNCWMTSAPTNNCCQGSDNQCDGTAGSGGGMCRNGAYTNNANTDSTVCSCMTAGHWNLGGNINPTGCCGAGGGEYYTSAGVGPDRCCNSGTACVDGGGTCRVYQKENITNGNCADGIDNDCDGNIDYMQSSCCPTLSGAQFKVTNTTGSNCFIVDASGNVALKGTFSIGAIGAPPANSYRIVVGGSTVGYIDPGCNMKIIGSVNLNQGSISGAGNNFIVYSNTGSKNVFKIDSSGNFYSTGLFGTGCTI